MSQQILVAGAINTDLVVNVDKAPHAGETVTGQTFSMHSGGKGANQAVAAARSGATTVMLGGVGQDDFGEARKMDLNAAGVDISWIATKDDVSSGVALIIVESSGENRICYIPAATLKVSVDDCKRALKAVQPGMILSANELSPACHRTLFDWARKNGAPVIFNAAPFSEEAIDLLPLVDVLIVNEGEALALLGREQEKATNDELAHGLRAIGAKDVIITLGASGSYALHGDESFIESAFEVNVVDTTGAGDTFCGAFAARLSEGASFREAVRHANAAGGIATTRAGAQSSIPTRNEVMSALGS